MLESDLREIMDELKRRIGPEPSVWLYHSSCRYHKDFQSIPADAVILCSNEFRQNERIGNVYCIKCHNNLLLKILLEMDIEIESVIFIRDGCVEGGNDEFSNTSTYFGRLLTVLREKSFVLTDHGTSEGFFDTPVRAIRLGTLPSYRSIIRRSHPLSKPTFWEVHKRHEPPTAFRLGNIQIQLIHGSIFDFLETLDLAVFFSHKPTGLGHYFELDTSNEVFFSRHSEYCRPKDLFGEYILKDVKRYIQISRDRIHIWENALKFAFEHKLERTGFVPFGWRLYQRSHETLKYYNRDYPKEIVLFHLNKGDYSYFYSLPYMEKTRETPDRPCHMKSSNS